MSATLEREWHRLQRREARLLRAAEEEKTGLLAQKSKALTAKIEEKIPEKLEKTLDAAFYKAFLLLFEKGTGMIEKTFDADALQLEFRVNDFRMAQKPDGKALRHIERASRKSRRFHACATAAEGIGLGALGIGLPDIPVFLAMLLRSLYETAASYGYDYRGQREQVFLLRLIAAALADGAPMRAQDALVDAVFDEHWIDLDAAAFDAEVRQTAHALSQAMLTAKFIQGLPIVGIAGGISNPVLYRRVMRYAVLKYKKRYLLEKRKHA